MLRDETSQVSVMQIMSGLCLNSCMSVRSLVILALRDLILRLRTVNL